MKKYIVKTLSFLLMVLVIFGCSSESKESETTKVKLGDLRSEFWLPMYVAQENGYFKDEGLDVEFVTFQDGPVELQSALNGEIDLAVLSTEPVLIAYEKELKSKILMATLKNKPFMLVANKSIKDIKELKGKKVAAGTPGSSPYAFVCSLLKKSGLEPNKDVTLVNMDYGASLAALDKNQIQATFLDSTRINQSDLNNINVLIDTSDEKTHKEIYGTDKYEASIVVASDEYIKNNKDTVQKFTNAMVKAMKWQQENSDEEIAKLVKPYFSDLDMVDIIKLTRSSLSKDGMISEEGYAAMEKFALDEGLITKPIPMEDIVDLTFVKEANK